MKFKAGDKVRVIKDLEFPDKEGPETFIGYEFVIDSVNPKEEYSIYSNIEGMIMQFEPSELELIK